MILGNTHVHYADVTFDMVDAGNSLYHVSYLVLSDRARGAAFEDAGYSLHQLWEDGYSLLVRTVTSEFLKPVPAGAKLAVLTEITLHGERSLTVSQEVVSRNDLPKIELNGSFVDRANLVGSEAIVCRLKTTLSCQSLDGERMLGALPSRFTHVLHNLGRTRPLPRSYLPPAHRPWTRFVPSDETL